MPLRYVDGLREGGDMGRHRGVGGEGGKAQGAGVRGEGAEKGKMGCHVLVASLFISAPG